MAEKKEEKHWAFAALRKRLAEKTQIITPAPDDLANGEPKILRITTTPDWEYGTIFLFNPKIKKEIHSFFYQTMYPQVLAVFEAEAYQIPTTEKIELREEKQKGAVCNALFIITDPKRPIGSADRPWWYVRFNLDVKADYDYFLNAELMLLLPYWLDSDWALDFVIDGRGWGNPPTPSASHNGLTLHFSWGRGTGYSFTTEAETQKFIEPFKKNLQIIKAIDRFSENPDNRFLKSYMLQVITEFYES